MRMRFSTDVVAFFIRDTSLSSTLRKHLPYNIKMWRLVQTKFGPPQAHCLQTQRYRIFGGDHLVFETSQVMNDIPFGDHFTVETRWDVTPLPPSTSGGPRCQVVTPFRLGVPGPFPAPDFHCVCWFANRHTPHCHCTPHHTTPRHTVTAHHTVRVDFSNVRSCAVQSATRF